MSRVPNTGFTLVKEFVYRDAPEEWTNHYWLSGIPPTSPAEFETLALALITQELGCYTPGSRVVAAYGYDESETDPLAKPPHAVWGFDYSASVPAHTGTLVDATGHEFAGDQAGFCWWKTSRRGTSGKPIYLRKYFHGGFEDPADKDSLSTATASAYQTFVGAMSNGIVELEGRFLQSHMGAEQLSAAGHGAWVTTRTLKRRGKRPKAEPTAGRA
jgi:hypothetical protein